jgi:hypothetical protein
VSLTVTLGFVLLDSMSDFRRVPADLNPAQAPDMLKRADVADGAGELAASDTSARAVR